jgi:ribonuclease HI
MSFSQASNYEAEYKALLHGMRMAKACGATRLKIFRDSNQVVQQVMNRFDAISDNMTAYRNLYYYIEGTFDRCEVSHVSRTSNEEADNLVLWSLRTTPNAATQETPFFFVHGAKAVVLVEITHEAPRIATYDGSSSNEAL